MNYISLVFILISIPSYTFGQSIEIPDESFKEVLLSASNRAHIAYDLDNRKTKIDLNDDGEIQLLEAEKISKLHIGNAGIKSLEGLEYFKNLREIFCQNNQIDSINIETLPKLTMLHCHHNNLTTVKIGVNTSLKRFYCSYNKFSSLNLEGIVSLETLSCNVNQLEEVNVNGCVNLIGLKCGSNQLEKLDLSTNKSLVYLSAGGNKLTTVDLTACQNIKEVFLHQNNLRFINFQNGLKSHLLEFYVNKNAPDLKVCVDTSDSFYRVIEDFRTPMNTCEDLTEVANLDIEKIITEEIIEEENEIKIYPNPTSGYFYLSESVSDLLIYDLGGKQCFKRSVNVNHVDVSFLPTGVYIVIYIDRQGEKHAAKLIKE